MRKTYRIPQSHVTLLYEDGKFVRVLEPGIHKLGRVLFDDIVRTVKSIDMRERSITIKGQEILTADKVAVRVSLLVYFRVQDAVAAAHNVASYEDRIYEDVQLAARRYLASRALDAILSDRNEISDAVRGAVGGSAAGYGVDIRRADVKDLVFPGNLREIMNRVIETERRAEAQLIEARQEAEALRIRTQAENEAELRRLEAEAERVRVKAEADRVRLAMELENAVGEAKAVADNPQLARMRELETLRAMAVTGARFAVGLEAGAVTKLLAKD